jgi:hypothetical protein
VVNKYKILDIDGTEISLADLLDKYFFSENYHTSCSVIETKYYNNVIEESSIVQDKQSKDNDEDEKKREGSENSAVKIDDANYDFEYVSADSSYLYECYYCDKFDPTDNRDDYEKHVVLSHDGKLAYPSKIDLEIKNLKPQGRSWEV